MSNSHGRKKKARSNRSNRQHRANPSSPYTTSDDPALLSTSEGRGFIPRYRHQPLSTAERTEKSAALAALKTVRQHSDTADLGKTIRAIQETYRNVHEQKRKRRRKNLSDLERACVYAAYSENGNSLKRGFKTYCEMYSADSELQNEGPVVCYETFKTVVRTMKAHERDISDFLPSPPSSSSEEY